MQMQLIDTRGAVDCYCRWTERAWYEYHPRLGRMSPVNLLFFDFSSLLVGGLSFILSIFLSPPLFNFSSTMPATVFSRSKRKLCLCLVQREYPFLSVLTFFLFPLSWERMLIVKFIHVLHFYPLYSAFIVYHHSSRYLCLPWAFISENENEKEGVWLPAIILYVLWFAHV